jgi:hypothetical protein
LTCWIILQVCDILLSSLGSDMTMVSRILLIVALLGLPAVATFAWCYQISATGINPTPAYSERRVLYNIAILDDRRKEPPTKGNPSREDASYDWVLEIGSGTLSGLKYGLESDVTVGRSSACGLTVPVGHISRRHLRFRIDDEGLLIEDLSSSDGTRVNGQKIGGAVMLHHHDKVEIKVLKNQARSRRGDATRKMTVQFEGSANSRKTQ